MTEPDGKARRPRRPTVRSLVRVAFLVLILLLAALALHRQWPQVRQHLAALTLAPLVAASACVAAATLATALAWRRLLADLGSSLGIAAAFRVFFVGQAAKYLPGSVWPVLAQMELARDHGVPRHRTAAATAVVLFLGVATALMWAAAAAPAVLSGGQVALAAVVLAALLVLLHPRVLNRVLARLLRIARRPSLERPFSGRGLAVATAWLLLSWLLYGVATAVVGADVSPGGGPDLLLSSGAYALAFAAGFLVLIAPAGLGVRESVLALALSGAMPAGAPIALALVLRLLATGWDLLSAGAGLLIRPPSRHRGGGGDPAGRPALPTAAVAGRPETAGEALQ